MNGERRQLPRCVRSNPSDAADVDEAVRSPLLVPRMVGRVERIQVPEAIPSMALAPLTPEQRRLFVVTFHTYEAALAQEHAEQPSS